MVKLFQQLTKSLSIKNIVILGVVIMAIIIVAFVMTMSYLSSTIRYDQTTLKNILELEQQNQNVLNIIRDINYVDNRIILSENIHEIESLEDKLLEQSSTLFIKKNQNYLDEYNTEVLKISQNLKDLILLQQKMFDAKYVILFYSDELLEYRSNIDNSIRKISNETEALYGKASLFSKRYTRKNKDNLDLKQIFNFERVMTVSKDLDSSIAQLPIYISKINTTKNKDEILSIKKNNLRQLIVLFENSLLKMNNYILVNESFVENINVINQEFFLIRDLIEFFITSKQQLLVENKRLESLLMQSENINQEVIDKIKKLNQISTNIKVEILSHSDSISKTTTSIIVVVGVISLFLLVLAAMTLIYRINFPLEFIIKYIEKIAMEKKDLSSKLPVITNDEFGKLSKSFNSMTSTIDNNITEIEKLNKEIEDTQKEVIFTMGAIGESRSKETGNHVKRVAEYSRILAIKYGLDSKTAELLKEASPMHDIGKVGIPDAILKKPAKLNEEEWEIMKTHAQLGYDMLKHSHRDILKAAAIVANEHHEKWDGSGYPRGIKGENIHIFGRITAVADVFDALGSDRCYKKAWPLEDIKQFFIDNRAKHFDPKLVDLFLENIDEFLFVRDKYKDIFD